MDNKKLDSLRDNINSLDDKILDLLKQRAEIVTEIGEQKKSKTNIVDIQRAVSYTHLTLPTILLV